MLPFFYNERKADHIFCFMVMTLFKNVNMIATILGL